MIIFYNEFTTAAVLSLIVAILVYANTPLSPQHQDNGRRMSVAIKSFIIAFAITFAFAYFVGDDRNVDVVSHMIKGEPDF